MANHSSKFVVAYNKNENQEIKDPYENTFSRRMHKFFCFNLKNAGKNPKLDRISDLFFMFQLFANILICIFILIAVVFELALQVQSPSILAGVILFWCGIILTAIYFGLYFPVYRAKKIPYGTLLTLYLLRWINKSIRFVIPVLFLCVKTGYSNFDIFIMVLGILATIYSGIAELSEIYKLIRFLIFGENEKKNKKPNSLLKKYQDKFNELKKEIK